MTSVLFADLVSYTTLSESRDTEDVRTLLSEYFDVCSTVVRRYGGTVEKFIGDAVMAVWGVPLSHEDDAERAVRAGLELVASVIGLGERLGVPELALRAGVVTGEVAATLGATDQAMVAGDPVNTASRIQGAAGPGEVWVDASTRALTAAAVTYFDAGEHLLKGKAEAIRLFRAGAVVAARGGNQRVDGLEAPLTGRDREMRLLKELFHGAEESGRPRLLVFDGEAGIGKSRLGWEFEKYIDGLSTPVAWHRGRCLSYGDGVAYWALSEAFRARVGAVEDDSPGAVLEGLDRVLSSVVPEQTERAWLRPRVASLLGEESREFAREDLFAAWTRFLERVGEGDPVVLLIDDAQYADAGLLDFIEHLLANSGSGMFVLLLARPELLSAHPQLGGRRASIVRLEPLPNSSMGELVDGLVDHLPVTVRAGLVQRADGIPLFAVETVRALIDRELVQPSGGRYVVAPDRDVDLSEIGAPASLHALVAARLDALGADERRVLTDASVLGESFTREGIGILSADVDSLFDVLASLQRKELIATDTDRFSAERGQLKFVQSVVRQVAYSTLARRDRKSRHLLVAEHLAAETDRIDDFAQVIARHLLDAAESAAPDDPDVASLRDRAAELLVLAGDRACALGSFADGYRAYDAALAGMSDDARRASVLHKKANACSRLLQFDAAVTAAQQSIELFDRLAKPVEAADAAYTQARALASLGRHHEVLELARTRREAVRDFPGTERVAGSLLRVIAGTLQGLGRYEEVSGPLEEALRLADRSGDRELLAGGLGTLAVQQGVVGSRQVAEMMFDAMAGYARTHEQWDMLTIALGNTGFLLGTVDLAGAIDVSRAAIANQAEHGLAPTEAMWANLCNWLWMAGRWSELQDVMDQVGGIVSDSRLIPLVASAVDYLQVWAGRPSSYADVSELASLEPSAGRLMTHAYRSIALALAEGNPASAIGHGQAGVAAELEVNDVTDDFHVFWPIAVRAAMAADDWDAVDTLLGHISDRPENALPLSIAAHRRVFSALVSMRSPDPDPEKIEADLLTGIADLETYGAAVWRAHAQEDLGNWLVAVGRAGDAEPQLEAARATYEQLGATNWLHRLPERESVSADTDSM
ncbi:MAG: ATP-binding protein [Nocardioidaceae bacterium]